MARPKKALTETRPHNVSFRLTEGERAELVDAAFKQGFTPNDLARYRTITDTAKVAFAPVAQPAFGNDEMVHQVTRLGINLNQIARRLNMSGQHEPDELREVCKQVDEVLRRHLASSGL